MDPPRTPNGTNYNLRQRHPQREKRSLSQSFLSSGSESPMSVVESERQSPQNQLNKKQRNEGRPRSASRTAQPIKGRPSIKRQPVVPSQFETNERSISGSIPPGFSAGGPDGDAAVVSSDPPAPSEDTNPFVDRAFSANDNAAVSDVAHDDAIPSIRNPGVNDETSFGAADGSADITFLKTAERSSVDASSMTADAPRGSGGTDGSVSNVVRDSVAPRESGVGQSSSLTPTSHGSAQFLSANAFYGSFHRDRSVRGASVSPSMGTGLLRRSPIRLQPVAASSSSPALSESNRVESPAVETFDFPKATTTDHNGNSLPSRAPGDDHRPLASPLMFGTDRSPSSRLARDFSDEDDFETAAKMISHPTATSGVSHSRYLEGGGDAPDDDNDSVAPRIVPPPMATGKLWNHSQIYMLIAMIVLVFLMIVGSFKGVVVVVEEEDDEREAEIAEPPPPSPRPPPREESRPPEVVVEPASSAYERVKAEIMSATESSVVASVRGVEDAWRESFDAQNGRISEAANGVAAVTKRLASLETAAEQFKVLQLKYGAEMRAFGMEVKRVDKAGLETNSAAAAAAASVSALSETVRKIEEKSYEMEMNMKAAVLRHANEIQALKSLVRVSTVPPSVNDTEILDKMKRLRDEMRSAITDEITEKSAALEDRLKAEMRQSVAVEIAASVPAKDDDKEYVEKEEVLRLIDVAIQREAAESEEMVDYALESQGGSVLDDLTSETSVGSPSSITFFGFTVWYHVNGPRTVILPGRRNPGQCWPMKGSNGFLVIKLSHRIVVSGFSLEHISKNASPINSVASAPKDFDVELFDDPLSASSPSEIRLGPFRYLDNLSDPVQRYGIDAVDERQQFKASYVKLNVRSNYGHPDYTCIYRFRVHGSYAGLIEGKG